MLPLLLIKCLLYAGGCAGFWKQLIPGVFIVHVLYARHHLGLALAVVGVCVNDRSYSCGRGSSLRWGLVRGLLAPAWHLGGWGGRVGIVCPMWRQTQLSEERQVWWKGL